MWLIRKNLGGHNRGQATSLTHKDFFSIMQ